MSEYRYEYLFPVPLSGSREEIFRAMTTAECLREWFAEHAEIGTAVGEPFRFWGRFTYGLPSREQADQQIRGWQVNDRVSFSWRLLDRDTDVTWSVIEERGDDGPVQKFKVTHSFPTLPDQSRPEALIDDLWRIYTGCLCFYLKGDQDFYRPDFGDDSPEVRCELVINAPPSRVFAALIEPDQIKKWFPAPNPSVDPRVGGEYGFGLSYEVDGEKVEPPPMTISAFEPDHVLEMNWPDWRTDPNVPDQTIRWELTNLGDGRTRLLLRHFGFTRAVDVSDYPFGWQEFLDKIQQVAEGQA